MMTSSAHCILVVVVWRLVLSAASLAVYLGVLATAKGTRIGWLLCLPKRKEVKAALTAKDFEEKFRPDNWTSCL